LTKALKLAIILNMTHRHEHGIRIGFEPRPSEEVERVNKSYRKTHERLRPTLRAKIFGGVMLSAVALGIVNHVNADEATHQNANVSTETQDVGNTSPYIVKNGDTAWEVARGHLGPKAEIRPEVDDIMKQASQDGHPGVILPGEKLELPKLPHQD